MKDLDRLDQLAAELQEARDLRQQQAERVAELKKQILDLGIQLGPEGIARISRPVLCW